MKKILLIPAFLFVLCGAFAQAPDSSSINEQQYTKAYAYATGTFRPYHPEKAFQIYRGLAQHGMPKAMNALGIMYQSGLGTDTNFTAAAQWFEKAGKAGYATGWYNLGMIYKYAYGVEQDMTRAYNCYKQAADLGDGFGKHALGYMLFKGLGCPQDYAAAFQLFSESAEALNVGGMYMLGICYRNGYGTQRDTLLSKKWLKKADSLGFYLAPSELYAKDPEYKLVKKAKLKSSRQMASATGPITPQTYKRIKHKAVAGKITAEYAGYVITYDHSGQYIIKQSPLRLTLKATGNVLTGQWIESDTLVTAIKAVLTDTCIIFTHAEYRYTDHYNTEPTLWKFTKASLDIVKSGDSIYLAGNLQLYSPETMEPEKPIYISVVKTSGGSGVVRKAAGADASAETNAFIAFPNPFVNELNLDFTLPSEAEVEINIYDMAGIKVYEALTSELPAGNNIRTIPLNVPWGVYIVKISAGSYKASSIVVKQ